MILALLFSAGLLNYFDRQTLSILKATLKEFFVITDTDYSYLIVAFMVPYIVMYVLSGRIVDRFGTRIGLTVFVCFWSLANVLAGLAQSFGQLAGARMLLGLAEPGAFPVMQRAIMTWFPSQRRAFAMSLCAPSTTVGAVLAPPLVAYLASGGSWRNAFILPGIAGVLVAVVWWFTDRNPPTAKDEAKDEPVPFRTLLKNRQLWGIVLSRAISDPVWYFHLFWMPGYLQERLGFSLQQLGWVGWIPSFAASICGIIVGRYTDTLVSRGRDPVRTRLSVFMISAVFAPLGALTTFAPNATIAMVLVTIVTMACQMWFFGTGVLLADLFPRNMNASAFGVIGAFGATTGLIMNFAAGPVIERMGYATVFMSIAFLHPIAAWVLRRTILSPAGNLAR
jgi:ACS family hexuronate transporter-like MFS transporter